MVSAAGRSALGRGCRFRRESSLDPAKTMRGHGRISHGFGKTSRGCGECSRGCGKTMGGRGEFSRGFGKTKRGRGKFSRGFEKTILGRGEFSRGFGKAKRGRGKFSRSFGKIMRGHPADRSGATPSKKCLADRATPGPHRQAHRRLGGEAKSRKSICSKSRLKAVA